MLKRLTNAEAVHEGEHSIRRLLDAHHEWLYAQRGTSAANPLRRNECDVRVSQGRLIFSCWDEKGTLLWRVTAWEWTGEKLLLEVTRRMGAERAHLELIPRASIKAAQAAISMERRARCQRLAELACALLHGAKVERAGLSAGARPGQPGPYARILLRHQNRERIAVAGRVAEAFEHETDALLSSTLLWFTRASERARPPYIQRLWLISEKDCVKPLAERLALLSDDLRRVIELYEIDEGWRELTRVQLPSLDDLLLEKTEPRVRPPRLSALSESAAGIVALAPEAIDVVRSRHGETLRFHGLAFARVRRVMGRENVWFGTGRAHRRLLDESTEGELIKLLQDLKEHRRAESRDQHHMLYRSAPEAWLESLLRRDITRLDPGLRLAPLYTQFRPTHAAASRPIDLLALRRDGRLVVIELKVSEDREHVLQGADYWRRVEAYRRSGQLKRARIFGNAAVSDEPPLVYLVAPGLRFHRAFQTLARAITPAIELYRFDLNEDWRAGVRVMRRETLTNSLQ
ncbi:MAG TPA: hypothetical protein VF791_12945 [Pyrinomonadaceae bacterium]